ncbi:unnamed protein product [Cercopithifilaria johnstoni]|uniref:Uncharacterized protein n=1 Tax=Cercopithifilaria johnstoni TaxID=2874296 RepID=A0A8J2LKZ3_9BILA|nr:unnamed protein product [Cercopithifilaria johnstoni]
MDPSNLGFSALSYYGLNNLTATKLTLFALLKNSRSFSVRSKSLGVYSGNVNTFCSSFSVKNLLINRGLPSLRESSNP